MPKGRVGVIGLGSIGSRRARILTKMGYEVIGADSNNNVPTPEGVKRIAGIDELWQYEPMAVFICTPPDSHATLIRQAYQQNCPAFVEKPLALGFTELPLDASWINMVACNWRFAEGIERLRQALALGFPHNPTSAGIYHYSYLPDWHPGTDWRQSYSVSPDCGVVFDVGWHLVDLALHLFGPARVEDATLQSAKKDLEIDTTGDAVLRLRHTSGLISRLGMNFCWDRRPTFFVRVDGTGYLGWELGHSHQRGWTVDDMYEAEMAHFMGCVEQGKATCNPISEAVKVLSILLEAKECAQSA